MQQRVGSNGVIYAWAITRSRLRVLLKKRPTMSIDDLMAWVEHNIQVGEHDGLPKNNEGSSNPRKQNNKVHEDDNSGSVKQNDKLGEAIL
ncbi:hypothetical protein U1Q18_014426, partial [Sarracenia purpurea var. burkii]